MMICIRNSRSLRPIVSPRSSVIIANRPAPKPLTPFTQKRGIIFQPTLIQVPGGKTVELASWFANLTARMIQQRPAILGRYSVAPVDLFRVNSGKKVKLRDYAAQTQSGRGLYDLHVKGDGLVHPAFGDNFEGPNGASLVPYMPELHDLVLNFKGNNATIFRIPKGTPISGNLVLLHEHTQHYALQCTKPMDLSQLNSTVSEFLKSNGETLSKEEFLTRFS